MINTELREKMVESLRKVRHDLRDDAEKIDRTPFTPRGVGEALGGLMAQVDAVARICEVILHDGQTRADGSTIV